MISAVVPAFNEQPTIGGVVSALRGAGLDVLVVDDGSVDQTARLAQQAGARLTRTPANGGKAEAMRLGLTHTPSDPVAFFDADLVGLGAWHVRALLDGAGKGYDMVCGLRDYGPMGNPLQLVMPLITGERIVSRRVLGAIPQGCWRGYAIETAMNKACSAIGGRTALIYMPGVTIRTKSDKLGWLRGLAGQAKMFARIYKVQECLDERGDCSVD
jgi:polyprenyl-phospho-N-acetylgalactosaminyl synthase